MTFTKHGNEIETSFSMAGCAGTEYLLMQKYLDKGYKELYNNAPYQWGLVNEAEMKIFTYTEGDVTLIKSKDKKLFERELNDYKEWIKREAGCY
jgi:hypothetical protein